MTQTHTDATVCPFVPGERSQARNLDQFYTRPCIAADCVRVALGAIGPLQGNVLYIEPSAGTGAFLDVLPSPKIGIDIAPADGRQDILAGDFLRWMPDEKTNNVVVIGNPPFGKNASLALKFLNHAARFADYVAFIVPRTFEKHSMQRKVRPGMTMIHQAALPADSFMLDDQPYAVPVVFQVWKKTGLLLSWSNRQTTHEDFEFVKCPECADFAFQRVGAAAGKVSREGLRKSPQSHYFIRIKSQKFDVMRILSSIDWSSVKYRTAGNPSIGKEELIIAYRGAIA